MSGKLAKSQIPILAQANLPLDVRTALVLMKNEIASGRGQDDPPPLPRGRIFRNKNSRGDGSPLPTVANGCVYYEYQVGQAHPNDPRPAGSRRLVAEVNFSSRQILEIYFTSEHYARGTFFSIL